MRVLIIGGGIAGVNIANKIKRIDKKIDVLILSKERYRPYDRIQLCRLLSEKTHIDELALEIEDGISIEFEQSVIQIDTKNKKVFSQNAMYGYDYLIIASGSIPKSPIDTADIKNASVFRCADDAFKIRDQIKSRDVVIVGAGAIGLETIETLVKEDKTKSITLLSRSGSLYAKQMNAQMTLFIKEAYEQTGKVNISLKDEIVDMCIKGKQIEQIKTKRFAFEDPFVIYGIGIRPNIDFARDALCCDRGILTDRYMQSSDKYIYAIGECAQISESGFVAGHVKDCIMQADAALSHIFNLEKRVFYESVRIDSLKTKLFYLTDIAPAVCDKDIQTESILINSKDRFEQYILNDKKLMRFIGINAQADMGFLQNLIEKRGDFDLKDIYASKAVSVKGKLVCSCTNMYEKDIEEIVKANCVESFADLKDFTQAGRVCGRCKDDVIKIIQSIPKEERERFKELKEQMQRAKKEQKIKKRLEKFNRLHPTNRIEDTNLEAAMKSFEISPKEYNKWISMVAATMDLHPSLEKYVEKSIKTLSKIPVIWLELADCSGNSEAFIKSVNPAIEDLIFDYISLDFHELLMASSSKRSESLLEETIKQNKNEYILIVEGAIPMGLEGKYLRMGAKGESGLEVLKKCAKDAALVIAVGSCAFDGGVVAAAPNPTDAVGVAEALKSEKVINLPGCPVNPINIVGTLIHYIMFEEAPKLDKFNRPLWAYGYKIHDNCERRGHFDLDEFVEEWGDEGAKKGWCLYKMGCKGLYSNLNCSIVKFNEGTSWPVQAGHGCMACGEKGFFDKYANERIIPSTTQNST